MMPTIISNVVTTGPLSREEAAHARELGARLAERPRERCFLVVRWKHGVFGDQKGHDERQEAHLVEGEVVDAAAVQPRVVLDRPRPLDLELRRAPRVQDALIRQIAVRDDAVLIVQQLDDRARADDGAEDGAFHVGDGEVLGAVAARRGIGLRPVPDDARLALGAFSEEAHASYGAIRATALHRRLAGDIRRRDEDVASFGAVRAVCRFGGRVDERPLVVR
mmetsp:Transcript_22234/g.88245  ORF Transcript_22234/g.88245 Transcript_22234/m.88245 type:complete len:221 (+) Transcript_22234:283-945(+)